MTLSVDALPGVQLGVMPGWLTGEPLEAQGVETQMPNLPDIDLPPTDVTPFELRVSAPQPSCLRLTLAPAGAAVLGDDGTGLGIVVEPTPAPETVEVEETVTHVVLTTGTLRLEVGRAPFTLRLVDRATGATLLRTADRLRQVAGLLTAPSVVVDGEATTLNLELGPDEDVLGFGEQFGRLVKNGQRLRLRSEDACGTGTGLAYKPVPVWHSSQGYTGFVNTGAVLTADVGHSMPSVLSLGLDDSAIDLYVFAGADPRARLTAYTALTGRATAPQPWAFGYWMGRCRYHSSEEMLEVGRSAREHGVPMDVLHLDPDWLVVDRLNTDFIWNTSRFGQRKQFVEDLAELGLRLSVWELPYLDPASPIFEEAERQGYLVRRTDGSLASIQKTPTPDGRMRALIDFTNPAAKRWWQEMHRDFLDDGVAVFKTDFGEALPDDVALFDGTPANQAHNLYPLRYNGAVSEAIREFTDRPPLVWGRSGWAGSHRYPGQWGGDAESTVAGMQATVRGGLSYAMSAPGFWSHDIGGFFGPELTPALYVRWTQLGALSPLMRAHGLRPREPWAFGDDALDICREWVRLRYSLLPYLWQVALESAANGWPVLRPLGLHHPDDRVARSVDDSFLLGSDLLVVPVFDDGAAPVRRTFYVPEGEWFDLHDDTRYAGPGFHTVDVPLDRMPVLVRGGAVIPRVAVDETVRSVEDLLGRPWTLHAYGATDGAQPTLVGFDSQPAVVEGEVVRHGA
ncbi:glycoside hydrolase family 31 protein [Humibacillus xanthopallidus]|uniref:glycoside hydrolase family 31 protein n=1 Tax=Humibacillus xanthopallidus TaxID=412689 RepID=UPI00163A8FD1|nr:glycoside hydrolase family 31 protein [Humibacillus xanthopallidus]